MTPKKHVMPRSASMIEKVGRLYDVFNGDDRVLIVINADPDAIASSMALKRLLWRRVASVSVARTNVIKRPDNLALLQFMKMPCSHIGETVLSDYSRLVMVDSQPHHQEALMPLQFDLIIDHHPLGNYGRAKFVDIRPDYGATATIMTEYLRAAKIKPSRTLATALFYAIKTDTNNFVRQGQLEDMRAFRFLFPLINQNMISKIENSDISRASLKYFRTALQRVKLRKDSALVYLDKVDNPDTLVMLADFMMRIRDVNRSIAAGLFKDNLVVIFRVVGSRANAGQMASKALGAFGPAGGHKGMARAEIPIASLDPRLFEKDGAVERFIFNRVHGKGGGSKPATAKP